MTSVNIYIKKVFMFLLSAFWLTVCISGFVNAAKDDGIPEILRYAWLLKQNTNPEQTSIAKDGPIWPISQRESYIRQLKNENRHLQSQLNAQGKDNNKKIQVLNKTNEQKLNETHKKPTEEISLLKNKISEKDKPLSNNKEFEEIKEKLALSEKTNKELKISLDELTKKLASMPVIEPVQLNKSENKQTYAVGVMIGRDILAHQTINEMSDQRVNTQILLAGVRDALNHNELLQEEELQESLQQAEDSQNKARVEIAKKWKKAGKTWLAHFKKQKDVTQDKSGFWYRIDYAGDGQLISGDNTIVDVVVTEKLTDGTIVEDMDIYGTVISQPLDEYPPVFRTALHLIKNHGTITVVVPSEMAYGDEGYPPKIPPGATMVYTIRVEDVKMESNEKN